MPTDLESLGIPVPLNARPDDELFQRSSSSPAVADSPLDPPSELVELPSHGYLYKNATDDQDVLEGKIRIRPMTVREEKILSTVRLVKSGQALDLVFKNCIKSHIDTAELLSSDRSFMMLWLRNVSYGNVYKFNLQCPECQKKFETEVDLTNHPVKELEDPEVKEPFEVTLPVSKQKVLFRLPRGKDEMEIMKLQNQPKKMNEADDDIVKRLTSAIIKITRHDGSVVAEKEKTAVVESWIARDSSTLRNELEKRDCGIEDIKGIVCPHCGNTFDSPIPITENFFRVTE
jgi:hypothetical protein